MVVFSRAGRIGASPEPDARDSPEALRAAPSLRSSHRPTGRTRCKRRPPNGAPRRIRRALRIVGYLGAAAFVIAAAWFGLATRGVTVARAPEAGPDATPLQVMRGYYRWQLTTLPQERLYTSIAIAGFLCLAVTAVYLRDLLGRAGARRPPRRRPDGHARQPHPGHELDRVHHRHHRRRVRARRVRTDRRRNARLRR